MQLDPGSIFNDVSAAITWLQHCQQYGIDECVQECELHIARNYLELANNVGSKEELATLSSSSLIRISQAYAICAWEFSRSGTSTLVPAKIDSCISKSTRLKSLMGHC